VVVDPPAAPAPFAAALDVPIATPPVTAQPITTLPITVPPQQLLTRESDGTPAAIEQPRSFVLASDTDAILGGFHKRDSDERPEPPLATFGETGPVPVPATQAAFLEDYDGGSRPRPMWAWVGMFAATGILLLGGAAWWAQAREARSTLLDSITATNPTGVAGAGGKPGPGGNDGDTATPVSAAPATPATCRRTRPRTDPRSTDRDGRSRTR
jgi:hypothetical protein